MQKILQYIKEAPPALFIFILGWLAFVAQIDRLPLFNGIEQQSAFLAKQLLEYGAKGLYLNNNAHDLIPPLYYWVQAISFKIWGISAFAARLPNAIIGIITMLVVFHAGKKYFDTTFGVLWAVCYVCMPGSFILYKSSSPFPLYNLLTFLSVFWLFSVSIKDEFEPYKVARRNKNIYLFLSAFAAGLSVVSNGIFSLIMIVSLVSFILFDNKGKIAFSIIDFIKWSVFVVLIIGVWLNIQANHLGLAPISKFFSAQSYLLLKTGTIKFFFQRLFILIYSTMPILVFAIFALKKNSIDTLHQSSIRKWMIVLLLLLILFGILSKEVAAHFATLGYFSITFGGAYVMHQFFKAPNKQPALFALIIFLIIAFATIGFIFNKPLMSLFEIKNNHLISLLFKDKRVLLMILLYKVNIIIALLLYARNKVIWGIKVILISSSLFYYTGVIIATHEIYYHIEFPKGNNTIPTK